MKLDLEGTFPRYEGTFPRPDSLQCLQEAHCFGRRDFSLAWILYTAFWFSFQYMLFQTGFRVNLQFTYGVI